MLYVAFIYGAIFSPTPIILFLFLRYVLRVKMRPFVFSCLSGLIIYITILAWAWIVDAQLQAELDAFDLNGDGFFSEDERSREQEEAMIRVVNDTGRALAPITGGIFSFCYVFLIYFLTLVKRWYREIDNI